MSASQIFLAYFGYPNGAVYSNLIASAICAGLVWWRLRARSVRQHVEQMALIAKLHGAHMQQAKAHQDALVELADKHAQDLLDRTDNHAESIKAHVTALSTPPSVVVVPSEPAPPVAAPAEAEKLAPEEVRKIRRQRTGGGM